VRDGLFESILAVKDIAYIVVQACDAPRFAERVKISRARSAAAKALSYSPSKISGWIELLSVRAASF